MNNHLGSGHNQARKVLIDNGALHVNITHYNAVQGIIIQGIHPVFGPYHGLFRETQSRRIFQQTNIKIVFLPPLIQVASYVSGMMSVQNIFQQFTA